MVNDAMYANSGFGMMGDQGFGNGMGYGQSYTGNGYGGYGYNDGLPASGNY